jgi:hypothetical protein
VTEASLDLDERVLDEKPADTSSRRRIPEWLVVVGVGVVAAIMFSIPYSLHGLFYYVGDNPESFVPLWHHLGEQLRAGHWPTMDAAGWYGGNYAAESAYSMWNPVELLNYVVVSLFDNLAAGAAIVMVEFLALFSMAVYLLSREYGAGRVPAVVVAIAMPACGFTLYYEAAGWPAGMMAVTWVTWFWWAAHRHARGKLNPIVPFLLGVLAMTTGNPYAALGMLIVLLGIGVELVARKQWRRLAHLVIMGVCVGMSGALVFLPLLGAMSVTTRETLASISNDTFMVPHLGDIAASSAPTYLPPILNWGGAVRENLPSTYFIWFVVPLLPWLRWRTLRSAARPLTSVAVISGCYLALVVGPSNLWLFRWPIRLIEYLYVGLAVLIAVLLTAGLAKDRLRERAIATVLLIGGGAYLSAAVRPEYYRIHAVATVIVLVLIGGAIVAYRRWGWRAFGAVLVIGTIGVVTYQTARIPVVGPGGVLVTPPVSVAEIQRGAASYQGTVLQLAEQGPVRTQDYADGDLLFGNENLSRGHETINHYSGIGFEKLTTALCMDYKGAVCAQSFGRLWQPLPGTDVTLVDALRVDTLVLQRALLPDVVDQTPPAGWQVAAQDDVRTVWVRHDPLPYPGRVSWVSPGVRVRSANPQPDSETVSYHASSDGQLMFARLDWPGYSATVDGQTVRLHDGGAGLVVADVPAGDHVLRLSFSQPGVRLGTWVLVGAAIIVVIQAMFWWFGGRHTRRRGTGSATGPESANAAGAYGGGDTMASV